MTVATRSPTSSARAADPVLADLVEQFLERLQAGEVLDPTDFAAAHPEHAEPLRQLLPALEMMAALSHSAARAGTGIASTADITGPGLGLLGDFHILREVGRGGMGVVYEAEQVSLRRRVALKVLPFAAALDPRHLARFKSEAQATALLHHTNIVPVHAVGAERGVHYYAMQFIDGRTLADVISELRKLEGIGVGQAFQPDVNVGRAFQPGVEDLSSAREGEAPSEPAEANAAQQELRPPDRLGRRSGEGDAMSEPLLCAGRGSPDPAPRRTEVLRATASAGRGSTDPTLGRTEGLPVPAPPSSSSTRNRAYFRNAARLGLEAAEALEHAHQEGIIHRDIKPANLMVDAKGHLWVTDFGLARLRGDSGLTVSGDLLGTLRYMSPEQASGKRVIIDGRTDIYSLGVTLYELVTLEPVFEGADRQELLRRIADEEPRAPRRLDASIPRDLETILLGAIAKEPDGRYQTAQELADDLRRFLDDKPIRAKRPSLAERAAKWARRHRVAVATTFFFLLFAVVTLATSTVLIARQQREVRIQRDEARQAVDDMYTDVATQWFDKHAALEPIQRRFLRKALDYYQRFAGEDSSDSSVRSKTAQAYDRVAVIQERLGSYPEAQAAYRRGLAILEKLVAEAPFMPEYQIQLARIQSNLGSMLGDLGPHAEGERLLLRAIALGERLVADSPTMPRYQATLAVARHCLAALLVKTGRLSEAEQEFRRAIALFEKLVADMPAEPEYGSQLAAADGGLASLLDDIDRHNEAVQYYRRAIGRLEELVAASPSVPQYRDELARHHLNLGALLYRTGQYTEAERAFGRTLALEERLAADSPSVPEYQNELAHGHNMMGTVLMVTRPKDAPRAFERAIALQEKLVAASPAVPDYQSELAATQVNLGVTLTKTRHYSEAEHEYRKAVTLQETLAAEWPSVPLYRSRLASTYANLGNLLRTANHGADAEQAYRRAITLEEKLAVDLPSQPQYRADLAWTHKDLGDLLAESGRPAAAEQLNRQAFAHFEKLAAEFPDVLDYQSGQASCSVKLAALLRAAGRLAEAEQEYHRAIMLAEKLSDPEPQNELSWALATHPKTALRNAGLALRLANKAVEQAPEFGGYWTTLGVTHYRAGDSKAAIHALEKSMKLRAGGDPSVWFFLAMACWQDGDKEKARSWYGKAVEWMDKNKSQDDELRRFRAEAAALLGVTEHPRSTERKEEDTPQRSKP